MEIIIYGIYDPNHPNNIRYVGKTKKNVKQRLSEHIYLSKIGVKRPLNLWIKKLLDNNIIPEIIEIEKTSINEWCDREIYWISFYREKTNLLNLSDGGGSNLNYSPSEETRKKISEGNKGKVGYWRDKKMTEEHKQKISDGGLGKKRSENTKKNISNSLFGKKLTEKHKKSLIESHLHLRKPVVKICPKTNEVLDEYVSITEALKLNGLEKVKTNLIGVCKGRNKTCGGFIWKYK
jgi:group I intron endonuclease